MARIIWHAGKGDLHLNLNADSYPVRVKFFFLKFGFNRQILNFIPACGHKRKKHVIMHMHSVHLNGICQLKSIVSMQWNPSNLNRLKYV